MTKLRPKPPEIPEAIAHWLAEHDITWAPTRRHDGASEEPKRNKGDGDMMDVMAGIKTWLQTQRLTKGRDRIRAVRPVGDNVVVYQRASLPSTSNPLPGHFQRTQRSEERDYLRIELGSNGQIKVSGAFSGLTFDPSDPHMFDDLAVLLGAIYGSRFKETKK